MISLDRFAGDWRLSRTIEDRRAGLRGRLEGTSHWRPHDDGLLQHERGQLHYGTGAPMQAERRYLWRQDGEGIAVFFEDGRPFHDLAEDRLSDRHDCPPDTYDVTYVFHENGAFSTEWVVTGPRKDLTILSRYDPL